MKSNGSCIKTLQLTEKSTKVMAENNQYFFEVAAGATKPEIRDAVQRMFKVHVEKVGVLNRAGKLRRERSQQYGRTSGFKRAVVTLRQGDSIETA